MKVLDLEELLRRRALEVVKDANASGIGALCALRAEDKTVAMISGDPEQVVLMCIALVVDFASKLGPEGGAVFCGTLTNALGRVDEQFLKNYKHHDWPIDDDSHRGGRA